MQQAFFYISLSSLHDYDVKMPSFTFFGGLKRATTNFPSLSELGYECKEFDFRIVRLHLVLKVSKMESIAIEFETIEIHFISDFQFADVAVVVS